jgi:hypothetical protein
VRARAEAVRRVALSRGALLGLAIAVIAAMWLIYAFVSELVLPPAAQRVDDLEVSLYPTLTGRPQVGSNQFEVKLRDQQGQLISQAGVEVLYRTATTLAGDRVTARPEGFGIFSTVLAFAAPGRWQVEVIVRRPGRPTIQAPFDLYVP